MAKLYASVSGEITAVRLTAADEVSMPVAPELAVSTLEFDPATNPSILPAYANDHNGHRLIAGVLTHNGTPYAIAADGDDEADRKALAARAQQLRDYLAVASPTNVQTVAALKLTIRVVLHLARRTLG